MATPGIPGVPFSPPAFPLHFWHLGAQMESFHFIHSQLLTCSTVSESASHRLFFRLLQTYVSPTAVSHCTVDANFRQVDHKIRSCLRLVLTISGGKMSFWSRSACIFPDPKGVVSTLAHGFAESCPVFPKWVVLGSPGLGGGRTLVATLFLSRMITHCHRTWLYL